MLTTAAPLSYEKSPLAFQPLVVSSVRAVHVPYGALPSAYAGTNAQFVTNVPAPSLTQWPAVHTTLLLPLSSAVPEHT